jgi:NADPH-dependent curcumin reductase CurA
VLLASRPAGWVSEQNFRIEDAPLPQPGEGEVLVKNLWLSLDPYMRGRMNEGKSYAARQEIGEVMIGGTAGEVVESRNPKFAKGDKVLGMLGWQQYGLSDGKGLNKVDASRVPLSAYLGVLGMPGVTAWVGLLDICQPKAGETVVVSAASGAVGSVVGQIAKIKGCRAVGIAGGGQKCDYVVKQLGFDACVDYKAGALNDDLKAAVPDGIDCYFENVGGDHLQAALACLNPFGRIAACGMIAAYNQAVPGPDNLFFIVGKKLTIRGFIVSDHAHREPAFRRHVAPLVRSGQLVFSETHRQGIESALDALLDVLRGGRHTGKMVVDL